MPPPETPPQSAQASDDTPGAQENRVSPGTAPVRLDALRGCIRGLRTADGREWGRLRIGAACTSLALHAGLVIFAFTHTPSVLRDGSGGSVPALTFEVLSPGRDGADDPPDSANGETSSLVAEAPSDDAPIALGEEADPVPTPRTADAAMVDPTVDSERAETQRGEIQRSEIEAASPLAHGAVAPPIPPDDPHPTVAAFEDARSRRAWEKRLRLHIARFKHYPGGTARIARNVTLAFTLDDSGRLVSATIARSSGDPAFDQAALGMMARADPLPRPPERRSRGGLTFTLPVTFRARRSGR